MGPSGMGCAVRRASVLLIVDDEPDFLQVLKVFAANALPGLDIRTSTSGAGALKQLRDGPIDVILCDYRMPDLDGIEVLRLSVELAPRARRVLMTAFADSSLPGKANEQVRLDGFFEKAMDPSALRTQLRALFTRGPAPEAQAA